MNRRDFIKTISAATGGVAFISGCVPKQKTSYVELFKGFQNPPAIARPFFRWWWNGNRVTKEEITRELELMADAGAGGVEINPIRLHPAYGDPPQRALDWLSDEWNQLIKHTVDECKRLGMYADLIVGTGWPFGGKFLADEETIQGLELERHQFQGPSKAKIMVFVGEAEKELLQVTLTPEKVADINQIVDLTAKVAANGLLKFDVPPGPHSLSVIIRKYKFRDVMHGAPGADGPVLDHFNKKAVLKYLNKMSDALNPVLGGKLGNGLRSMFCDSIELKGANWTSDIPLEFEQRMGYDVKPYLSLLLQEKVNAEPEFAKKLNQVRFDYSKLLSELFMERFIVPFHEWCRENGTLSRYQAYGVPYLYTDLVDGYMVPDIPESDQWLFNKGWVHQAELDELRYATWNKYASAGARLTGKKITSCEAMTNTAGVFEATLEYIKQGTDINIITGVNHMVLHGFNYSPPEVDFPGWIRYGTYYNENNPWWPYTKLWMDYAARLCYVFQESKPFADVAIIGPTFDVWSEFGLDREPWLRTPKYLHALWQSFNHHGYFADYINPNILENASFENGELRYGPMSYKLLVFADVKSLRPASANALIEFVKSGGKIVFLGTKPVNSIVANNGENVEEIIDGLLTQYKNQIKFVEGPIADYPIEQAGQVAKELELKPSVEISNPDPKLFFIPHKIGNLDIYFFSNMDRQRAIESRVKFPINNKTPWRLDAETGEKEPILFNKSSNELELNLAPLESLLLVYENENKEPYPVRNVSKSFLELTGPWDVELVPTLGQPGKEKFDQLFDFAQTKEYRDFSGVVIYRTEFTIDSSGKSEFLLEIGRVDGCAEVWLNGKKLGVQWWGKKTFAVGHLVKKVGEKNNLEIKVSTVLINLCASLEGNEVTKLWTTPRGRNRRVSTGLLGPVGLFRVKE